MSVEYGLKTKTGMMVGLGETAEEVLQTMKEVREIGVEIFTVGQYLQPSKKHLSVERYVSDSEFIYYKNLGIDLGFKVVKSGFFIEHVGLGEYFLLLILLNYAGNIP